MMVCSNDAFAVRMPAYAATADSIALSAGDCSVATSRRVRTDMIATYWLGCVLPASARSVWLCLVPSADPQFHLSRARGNTAVNRARDEPQGFHERCELFREQAL